MPGCKPQSVQEGRGLPRCWHSSHGALRPWHSHCHCCSHRCPPGWSSSAGLRGCLCFVWGFAVFQRQATSAVSHTKQSPCTHAAIIATLVRAHALPPLPCQLSPQVATRTSNSPQTHQLPHSSLPKPCAAIHLQAALVFKTLSASSNYYLNDSSGTGVDSLTITNTLTYLQFHSPFPNSHVQVMSEILKKKSLSLLAMVKKQSLITQQGPNAGHF